MLIKTLLICCIGACAAFNNFYMRRHYNSQADSDEDDNSVLRSYRRCMWEQSKLLPRRLVMLSLCSNLFCENNQIVPRSSCLDILPDDCEQGDEEELMYKAFPDCCPVFCNLKRRMQRLKRMRLQHRLLQSQQQATANTNVLLGEYGLNTYKK